MPCPVLGLDRLALHAASVEFLLPNNKRMKLEAPLPEEMKRLFDMVGLNIREQSGVRPHLGSN